MQHGWVWAVVGLGMVGGSVVAQEPLKPYRSPYRVEFRSPLAELVGDLERTERGDPRLESSVPHGEWYGPQVLKRWRSWGPPARHYPVPSGMARWTTEQKRERTIAVALRFQGYAYQHHHIPDWTPPAHAGFPWQETCAGANGKGVDCSNYTCFVFNQGFGAWLNSDVHKQAEERSVRLPDGELRPLHRVELPSDYDERIKALRTGDLLFICGKPGGSVTHVVLWVGPIGQSPDGVPLVLDSHGADTHDSNKELIPCGIHLRPFRRNSWYNGSASHALRLFPD